jgi:hypothetical protein
LYQETLRQVLLPKTRLKPDFIGWVRLCRLLLSQVKLEAGLVMLNDWENKFEVV